MHEDGGSEEGDVGGGGERIDGSPLVTICVSARCSDSVRRSYF